MSTEFEEKIRRIKLVITDVDGVLTDGGMYYNNEGEYMLRINQNPENDEFLIVQANTILSTGQEARNNFWEKLILDGLPEDLVGEVPQG